ncbi:hypothetical protein SUGI_0787630 [Cryptomeria japonica]|nr:hypothetical protein SUGI_0787630 [Cryptomeria japonica]
MEDTTSGETNTNFSTERSDSHLSSFNISDIENGSASDLERQIGFGAPQVLEETKRAPPNPKNAETRLSVIMLDQGLFTIYKILHFITTFALNFTELILAATGHFPYAEKEAALFSVSNILALVLCRSEVFLRILFWVAVKMLGRSWVAIPLKTAATSLLQCLGGIHSGCGISSIMWLIYSLVQILSQRELTSSVIIGVAAAILGLLFISSAAAFPLVAVQVSVPSAQASLIKFGGGVNPGLLDRISRSPLSDWHAFGIISDGKDENLMLAGEVGDFTTELVSDPPKFLYTRCIHFAGLPYLVNMYEKVVVVATGSGIGVFLSFMLQRSRADVYFIWVTKSIQRNFRDEIVRKIESYPSENMIVHDTAVSGRPNVVELTVKVVRDWSAQVVIVTSNPVGSRDVVKKCRGEGIPAFGPIWDSYKVKSMSVNEDMFMMAV